MLSTNIDTLIITVCCPLRAKSPSALRKIYSAAKLKFASVLTVQEKRGDSVFKRRNLMKNQWKGSEIAAHQNGNQYFSRECLGVTKCEVAPLGVRAITYEKEWKDSIWSANAAKEADDSRSNFYGWSPMRVIHLRRGLTNHKKYAIKGSEYGLWVSVVRVQVWVMFPGCPTVIVKFKV
jgi:hypothetical protein